jgi:hypothetical protein
MVTVTLLSTLTSVLFHGPSRTVASPYLARQGREDVVLERVGVDFVERGVELEKRLAFLADFGAFEAEFRLSAHDLDECFGESCRGPERLA